MPSHDLMQHLSVIPDPRIDRNKKHDLAEMLFVAVCATLSGAEGSADIVEFAESEYLGSDEKLLAGATAEFFI